MQQQQEEELQMKRSYTYNDLLKFQDPNLYSSIGKMRTSKMPTAPSYGFGTADRNKQDKIFQSKELSKTQFLGKTSPGPNYEVRESDKYYYKEDPKWSFGTDARNTLNTGSKYAYYHRPDSDFDPITADNTRKWASATVRIGLENRFPNDPRRAKANPGPEYDPCLPKNFDEPPKYSFGVRRPVPGFDPLAPQGSTPSIVGPGSYLQMNQKNTSEMPDHPVVSFTKQKKFFGYVANSNQKNQTYDTRSAIGPQVNSKNKTLPQVSFGKAHRDNKAGLFKSHMSTQPTKIRIEHPKM